MPRQVSTNCEGLKEKNILKRGKLIRSDSFAWILQLSCSFRMNLYVEDNGFHYGPIRIYARVNATLDDLKTFVSLHLKIPQQKQKWFMRNGKMFEPLRGTTLPKKDKASVDLYVYITTGME